MTNEERIQAAKILQSAIKSMRLNALTPAEAAIIFDAAAVFISKLKPHVRAWYAKAAIDAIAAVFRDISNEYEEQHEEDTTCG